MSRNKRPAPRYATIQRPSIPQCGKRPTRPPCGMRPIAPHRAASAPHPATQQDAPAPHRAESAPRHAHRGNRAGRPLPCVQNRRFRANAHLACAKLTVLYAIWGTRRHSGSLQARTALTRCAFPQFKALRIALPRREAPGALTKRLETRTKPSISCRGDRLLHETDGFVRNGRSTPPEPGPPSGLEPRCDPSQRKAASLGRHVSPTSRRAFHCPRNRRSGFQGNCERRQAPAPPP